MYHVKRCEAESRRRLRFPNGMISGRSRRWKHEVWRQYNGVDKARGQELGVILCLEPLNRFETYLLNTLADAAEMVHFISEPNVRIHFDTFHANIEDRHPAESILAVAKDMGHVHLSENDRIIPGTGYVDCRGTVGALKQIGHEGWLTTGSFAKPEPGLAAAAAIGRDLVPSGDELARRGLAFIKAFTA